MRIVRLIAGLSASACLWAGYQYSFTDTLTSISSSKWSQIGTLSAGPNGITGNGALISTVAIPTGNDYDVRLTVATAAQGACAGSYSLYARSTPDNSTTYALTAASGTIALYRVVANVWTELSWLPYPCGAGTTMRLVVRGSSITFWSGPNSATYLDSTPIVTGQPGVGISSTEGDSVGNVQIGPIDYLPPAAIVASTVQTSTATGRVDLRWPAAADDVNGAGLQGYVVYRDGVYLGSPSTPHWLDLTLSGGEKTVYSIYAADQHGNLSAPAVVTVSVPEAPTFPTPPPPLTPPSRPSVGTGSEKLTPKITVPGGPSVDQLEIGVRPTGTYWGAAGENIDLLSGNLNFTVPLIKAMSRTSMSVTFALSYNSQMWRQDSGGVWLLGEDLGLGLGWTLQAGSILPVWYNGSIECYIYSDSTGAQYALDRTYGSNVWFTEWGPYVWFDGNADVLHFPDGSFWNMNVQSGSAEQDAGTLYPSQMEDTNANFISLTYAPEAGCYYWCTQYSSRIASITDPRGNGGGGNGTYVFNWSGSGLPHLTEIGNNIGTPESYSFTTVNQTLLDPFTFSNFSGFTGVTTLSSLTIGGLGIAYQFQYDSSAEMTGMTTPLGGMLGWTYRTNAYGSTRSYREVQNRTMQSTASTTNSWSITQDSNATFHTSATVADNGANTQKAYTFQTGDYPNAVGLIAQYQEIGTSGVLLQKSYAWNGNPNQWLMYTATTLNPNTSYAAQTVTYPGYDNYGNLTSEYVYDYSNSPTGTRLYEMAYSNTPNTTYYAQYQASYIFNRMLSATVSQNYGTALTLSTVQYDGSCGPTSGDTSNATNNHDPNYSGARGNPTSGSGLNGGDWWCAAYDSAGVPYLTENAAGQSMGLTTDASTNFSLPTIFSPNGSSAMQTTATYASSWAVTSLLGPNGGQATTTYDSYGRPSQSTTPDGATTNYTYTYSPFASTQTATLDGRWQTTTLDGFGRTIQVQKGNGSTVVSTVQTVYAPCACSPLGKMSQVSQPYAPGATKVWTTYTYDASGRTLTITAPDGASVTTYTYQGNSTTVTDPAGKWKTSTVDAYGNVTQVTEPNPAGGTFTTNYAYTPANQLTGVSITRGNVTETRTFLYNGSDLISAANPENGTITYTYDGAHHVLTRTDALGSVTQYSYDSFGRLTEQQYYPWNFYNGTVEDTTQRVTYYYDNSIPPNSQAAAPQNGTGRLTGVSFADGYDYLYTNVYSYSQAGRVTLQTSAVATTSNPPYPPSVLGIFTNAYQWDDEGRVTSMTPYLSMPSTHNGANFTALDYEYDANGRLSQVNSGGIATATYTAAGQLATLNYGGTTETRGYNNLGQLTSQSVPGYLSLAYQYSANQNNGRVIGIQDGMTGENTTYTYDSLNRLTGASNSMWSETYSYDGFGNLTSKSGSGGSPNPAPSMTASYNANNQQAGVGYDANGNASSWGGYSTENRLGLVSSSVYPYATMEFGYDPWGKRVRKYSNPDPNDYENEWSPQWEFYFYTITGQRLVTMDCTQPDEDTPPNCWGAGENVYFGKKLLVSNGVYVVTDRLGTVRANTQGETFAYYPYGEERTNTVNDRDKFATYLRDAAGQDYADQRYYGSGTGRFWSVDPGGIRTANPGTPLSWNRYAYTYGDPVNFMDRHGLEVEAPDDCYPDLDCNTPECYDASNEFLGMPDPGCPTGGGGGPSETMTSASPSCDPKVQSWIDTYGADAVATGLSEANVLATSAIETGWGTGRFAVQGNSFFNLETEVQAPPPGQLPNLPPTIYAYQKSWIRALEAHTSGPDKGKLSLVASYSSAADSFKSFAATLGNFFSGVTDPATFAKLDVAHGIYAGSNSGYLSTEQKFQDCLNAQKQ